MDGQRKIKLHGFFMRVIQGKDDVLSPEKAKRFLEAVYTEPDPVGCVSQILSSANGLKALQQSVRLDATQSFMNTAINNLLKYLQHPELAVVCNGDLLRKTLHNLSNPGIFFNAIVQHVENAGLLDDTVKSFAWMLLQLIHLPQPDSAPFIRAANQPQLQTALKTSGSSEIRNMYQKITKIISMLEKSGVVTDNGPGGRHDNDFEDFRKIDILPTVDELSCRDTPFLRFADEVDHADAAQRLTLHLDNQYRLLREDMISDVREEMQLALTSNRNVRKALHIKGLRVSGLQLMSRRNWALVFECTNGLDFLKGKGSPKKRSEFLSKHQKLFAHGSLACIISEGKLIGLGLVWRQEDAMAQDVPHLHLHLPESKTVLERTLSLLRKNSNLELLQLQTPVFAYQPILSQLKNTRLLPLADQMLGWSEEQSISKAACSKLVKEFVEKLKADPSMDLKSRLSLPKSVILDPSQHSSLITALEHTLSVLQGPPGTGKSFIGAIVAKVFYKITKCKILVLSFTNHALDQFLEDLLDIDIKSCDMIRLGRPWKASDRTKPMVLSTVESSSKQHRLNRSSWKLLDEWETSLTDVDKIFRDTFEKYNRSLATKDELMEHLEFSECFANFHSAFQVPEAKDGFQTAGRAGKKIDRYYLFDRWVRGKDAGVFRNQATTWKKVWNLAIGARKSMLEQWNNDIFDEYCSSLVQCGTQHNGINKDINNMYGERGRKLMRDRRIIGCTTTVAAKNVADIQSVNPDIVIVEEAGEILESHILTALGPGTKQLVLIGDHKQLRPKVQWSLSVEKGVGYDLNRSLFERLVLKNYPHEILFQQHRMRPEISALVRAMTYPDLIDAPVTKSRPPLRGFQDNVIFFGHDALEDEIADVYDPREGGFTRTKSNSFEAEMTLCCVRYLAQQGYRSDQVVILTPYLGQLRLLLDKLSVENDPILNDMDCHDLRRAGLLPMEEDQSKKPRIRISSIDNYQGEESDVVIASLTRSNKAGDIGFLQSPERLNVLLSRARDGLILLGNIDTFQQAKQGRDIWHKFLSLLKDSSHIYSGFPVHCERHPERRALIRSRNDFDTYCPDGGCAQPCGTILSCGLHSCVQKCHQLCDHSKIICNRVVKEQCATGHTITSKCADPRPVPCDECEHLRKRDETRLEAEHNRRKAEAAALQQHEERMTELENEIEKIRWQTDSTRLEIDRKNMLEQKMVDLENAKELAKTTTNPEAEVTSQVKTSLDSEPLVTQDTQKHQVADSAKKCMTPQASSVAAASEWIHMRNSEGLSSTAVDKLMQLTGLEDVKQKFLSIFNKIQATRRQGVKMEDERFGALLLGNPGTGKTTVARIYAQFLAEVRIVPDAKFIESNGAKLASDGVSVTSKQLTDLVNAGGGVFFIDEAYQLTSGNSPAGKAVLDYILAEIENVKANVVFVFAGYEKQMETFLQHNPGLPSRLPNRFKFTDYSEPELLEMLQQKIAKKYKNKMKIEDGPDGLYMRITIRRLHRSSGREGFGNARELENTLNRITSAQSTRLSKERRQGCKPDDFLFIKEDLIGPEPSNAALRSSAWKDLQEMIGLDTVKSSVLTLLHRLQDNYQRELKELPPVEVSLNRLFLGSPGTGKTTVAKLYGQILADVGVLSLAECVMKTPADFIGSVIGESERNTKSILDSTKGKVLVIDEAYMLGSHPSPGSSSTADPYRTAVVDTIVSEVHSTPGDDRAVLLLGYQDQMEKMLQQVNPGLPRRFPISSAFIFEDYDDQQLLQILNGKLKKQGILASDAAKQTAIDMLSKARRLPKFGNAGEVENLLSRAKDFFAQRQRLLPPEERTVEINLEPQDFDADFARSKDALVNCKELFRDVVGSEDVIEKVMGYVQTAESTRQMGIDPEQYVPFNFIFKGPPGTGKTTIARKFGTIFYDMGFLASDEVIECSATDLIGEYIGQTGPKVLQKLDQALGKILFIDEAYRLSDDKFAKEAVDELVDSLTKVKYKGKMIVILAGYEQEVNRLLSVNPGLSSRFPEEVMFQHLDPHLCLQLLRNILSKEPSIKSDLDLQHPQAQAIAAVIRELSQLPAWGNGRDIETMAKRIISAFLKLPPPDSSPHIITWDNVQSQVDQLLKERRARKENIAPVSLFTGAVPSSLTQSHNFECPPKTTQSTHMETENTQEDPQEQDVEFENTFVEAITDTRDPGVSDADWQELQRDADAAKKQEAHDLKMIAESCNRQKELDQQVVDLVAQEQKLSVTPSNDENAKRLHEAMRLKAIAAKRKAGEERDRLRELEAQQRKKREAEAKAQRKLRELGVCPAGFRWIKQSSGYRCAGGTHFVSNEQLDM